MNNETIRLTHKIEITDPSTSVSITEEVFEELNNIESILRLVKRALLALGYDNSLVEERVIIKEN